jgi:hypothetical protein
MQVEDFLLHSEYEDDVSSMENSFRNICMEHVALTWQYRKHN